MLRVISASRRIDMVAGFPDDLARLLREKCPPAETHSVVLWTKNPANLFGHAALRETLAGYEQLFVHYTVTGMGGTFLEPRVPDTQTALGFLPALVRLTGSPERIRMRFDPIVHLRPPSGEHYTNFGAFDAVAQAAADAGVLNVTTSWVALYKKVLSRLAKHGIMPISLSPAEWQAEAERLQEKARRYGIALHGCCVPGWPRSRCIDGDLLTRLHPRGLACSTAKAKGQREICGCTESLDLGWYNPCPHGCLYCYGNPRTSIETVGEV
ncbi:MAG: DUF1848 domain-containing protein [Planctomycetes bacterium]|nr:DUF1848 domain-containing protein [Planctomycetota bacterium]